MNEPARTMVAMRASGPDTGSLSSQTLPVPAPGPGELLVEVRATAVTTGELSWPESWPTIPCHDLSGVVAATGHGVTGWQAGDMAYGLVAFDRPGAAAQYVTVPAADLAPKPSVIDDIAAAAVPLGALTAWQALHEHAQLRSGQHVLVRPVLEQLLANELVVRQLGAARNPGVDGNKGSLIDAGQLSAYRSAGRLRGLPLTPAMILRTPGIIRLLPPGRAR